MLRCTRTIAFVAVTGLAVLACERQAPTDLSTPPGAPLFGEVPAEGAASVYDEATAGDVQAVPEIQQIPCVGGETFLLIQNNVPWFAPANQDPLGANVTELKAQGKSFCMINSSQIGATNLAQFPVVLIAAAQNQTFYNDLFPGGTVHPAIAGYVQGGGVLSASLADFASGPGAGGNWFGDVFVGGLQRNLTFDQNNNIADPTHPIIADALPCPGGNCAPIVDAGAFNDLDSWGSSNHGHFFNLPPGTTVIITDGIGRPVAIEYPFGSGTVIATMTTTEWRYAGNFGGLPQNLKLLANDIAYQDFIAVLRVVIDIKPGSDPNSINPRNTGVIPVAILTTSTAAGEALDFDAADVDVSTVAFGPGGAAEVHGTGHMEDVDGDGDLDMVLHFGTQASGLTCGDTEATLTGQTLAGRRLEGTDAVNTVGCDKL